LDVLVGSAGLDVLVGACTGVAAGLDVLVGTTPGGSVAAGRGVLVGTTPGGSVAAGLDVLVGTTPGGSSDVGSCDAGSSGSRERLGTFDRGVDVLAPDTGAPAIAVGAPGVFGFVLLPTTPAVRAAIAVLAAAPVGKLAAAVAAEGWSGADAVARASANGRMSSSAAAAVADAWASGGSGVADGAFGSPGTASAGTSSRFEGRIPAFRLFGFNSPTRQTARSTTTLQIASMAPNRGK
jgi:hypothetical protein